jgi:hypothetical protein
VTILPGRASPRSGSEKPAGDQKECEVRNEKTSRTLLRSSNVSLQMILRAELQKIVEVAQKLFRQAERYPSPHLDDTRAKLTSFAGI